MAVVWRPALGIVLCALVLGGCGGSDAEPAGTDAGSRREAREPESARAGGGPDRAEPDGRARERSRRSEERPDEDRKRRRAPALPKDARRDAVLVGKLVRALVRGLNARDASICERLFDQRLIKPAKRESAEARCRRDVAARTTQLKLVHVELVRIEEAKAGERRGVVQFVVRSGDRQVRSIFQVIRSGGRYRFDAAIPAKQPE